MLDEIQLELCGVCNATCSYCTWQLRTVGKQRMDTQLALRLLREAHSLGVRSVRYHGLGESLLHPDLLHIVSVGEALGVGHSLSTNCFNLRDELAAGLAYVSGLHLILAVPWVMHDRFVDRCLANAVAYMDQGPTNHRIHVQMVCVEGAEGHYAQCVEAFRPLIERHENLYLHLKQPVTWPNDTPNVGFIRHELRDHPKVIFDERATPLSIGKDCTQPDRMLMVLADGTLVPCCVGMTDWGLGQIGDRTLQQVWESVELEVIRQQWRDADDAIPCGHCKKRTDCLT